MQILALDAMIANEIDNTFLRANAPTKERTTQLIPLECAERAQDARNDRCLRGEVGAAAARSRGLGRWRGFLARTIHFSQGYWPAGNQGYTGRAQSAESYN